MKININEEMNPIIDLYYQNDAKKLHNMVDKILFKLHFVDIDNTDFYSLANEVFMYALRDYDSSKSFDGFLYSCLYKKFCSEMTGRLRDKRCTKVKKEEKNEEGEVIEKIVVIPDISLYTPIGDENNSTIEDTIADEYSIEKEIFEENEEGYSQQILMYLNKLSDFQKEVLELTITGYLPDEIREKLHMSEKEYSDCYAAIRSYKNISVLF